MATGRDELGDLVILLPGITGSVLERGGTTLWNATYGTIWRTISSGGDSLRSLRLDHDDITKDQAPDGVTAPSLIEDAHLVPGLVKIDGYTDLPVSLAEAFDVIECGADDDVPGNFMRFPYDWRRDVRASARRLKNVIDRKLDLWRTDSRNPDARVILVGHSMGGLVSQYYLEVLEGWKKARALITFGTPFRGSLQAVEYICNGYKMMKMDFTEMMRSFPSVYQLLPRYEAIQTGSGWKRVAEISAELRIPDALIRAHKEYHAEVDAAYEINKLSPEYLNEGYVTCPVVGTRQLTMQSGVWDGAKMIVVANAPPKVDSKLVGGDGTVPRVAAIPLTQSAATHFKGFFPAQQHGALQKDQFVLNDLIERIKLYLAPSTEDLKGGIEKAGAAPLGLEVEDVYLAKSPALVFVSTPTLDEGEKVPSLVARVEPIEGGASREFEFTPAGPKRFQTQLDGLGAGGYRIKVGGRGADTTNFREVDSLFVIDEG